MGSLWYYANPDAAPDVEKCTAGVQLEAGFQEAVWLDDTKVLVGLDTGNAPNRYGNMSDNAPNRYGYNYVSVIRISLKAIKYYSLCFHRNNNFTFDCQTLSIVDIYSHQYPCLYKLINHCCLR